MTSLRSYPAILPTLLFIQRPSTQPLLVPLSTSTYGLCRVNPHLLLIYLPLLHQQGPIILALRSLITTPYIPVVSTMTRKYWKNYTAQTFLGTHYIIVHSSSHRKPSCLLTKTPCTRSKPKILSHLGLLIGSKIPSPPLMHLKKVIWPTFPPPSKSTFPSKVVLSKKSSLELLALPQKLLHTKPSSKNTEISSLGHTQRCLGSIHLSSSIASTLGQTSPPFARNNDRYTHPKPRLSKPKLTNYVQPGLFTPLLTPPGFPTLYPSTRNRALSMSAHTFAISITHVPKTTFQCPSSIRLSMTVPATRLSPSWTDSLAITKFKSTQPISIKLHSLPHGVLSHIVSCLLA
jgi:hypothetical protein